MGEAPSRESWTERLRSNVVVVMKARAPSNSLLVTEEYTYAHVLVGLFGGRVCVLVERPGLLSLLHQPPLSLARA